MKPKKLKMMYVCEKCNKWYDKIKVMHAISENLTMAKMQICQKCYEKIFESEIITLEDGPERRIS